MADETYRVMLVDDEPNIINALHRLLRREGYEIVTANSGIQALELFEKADGRSAVVVSDFRMPEMNGIEFLRCVCERYPDTVRIILSGYADAEAIQAAINEGHVYKYVSKPWDDEELREVVRTSVRRYEAVRKTRAWLGVMNALEKEMEQVGVVLGEDQEDGASDRRSWEAPAPKLSFGYDKLNIWREMVDLIPAAVIGVDLEEMIVVANPATERILKMDRRMMLGNQASTVLPAELAEMVGGVARGERMAAKMSLMVEGQPVKVECVALAGNNDGEVRGALLFAFQMEESP